jgi:hypothetical protein
MNDINDKSVQFSNNNQNNKVTPKKSGQTKKAGKGAITSMTSTATTTLKPEITADYADKLFFAYTWFFALIVVENDIWNTKIINWQVDTIKKFWMFVNTHLSVIINSNVDYTVFFRDGFSPEIDEVKKKLNGEKCYKLEVRSHPIYEKEVMDNVIRDLLMWIVGNTSGASENIIAIFFLRYHSNKPSQHTKSLKLNLRFTGNQTNGDIYKNEILEILSAYDIKSDNIRFAVKDL